MTKTGEEGVGVPYSRMLMRDMWVLAFDTSGPHGSVAVGHAGEAVAVDGLGAPREHAARLLIAARGLLERQGMSIRDIGGIVVGDGPGSFTGVRVAAATAKGLWHGIQVPVWPVSSLRAAVCDPSVRWSTQERAALFDARGDRVYGAAFRVGPSTIEEVAAPFAADLDDARDQIVSAFEPGEPVFCGSGAWRHQERLGSAGLRVEPPPAGRPSARGLLAALRLDPTTEAHDNPAQWEPAYLRASSAERLWRKVDASDSGS